MNRFIVSSRIFASIRVQIRGPSWQSIPMDIEPKPRVIVWQDEKALGEDPVWNDYHRFRSGQIPIIIDNGSYHCRAGWSTEQNPRLDFRCIVAKPRFSSQTETANTSGVLVGNEITQADLSKMSAKSAFSNNIIYNFDTQECILDHVFSRLGINTEKVDHPILMTEAVANPNYCRRNMSELLFECYRVPSVCYGIDGLFSFYENAQSRNSISTYHKSNALVLTSGLNTTHVLPVLNGKLQAPQVKRISIGGQQISDYGQQLLAAKYPAHKNFLTAERAKQITEKYTYVAPNYTEELEILGKSNSKEAIDKALILQLPFTPQAAPPVLTEEEKQRKQQMRVEQGQRLKQLQETRRAEKLAEQIKKLAEYEELKALKASKPSKYQKQLAKLGFTSDKQFSNALSKLKSTINKQKGATTPTTETASIVESEGEENTNEFPLADIPDEELTPEQLKEKRKQVFVKKSKEARQKAKQKKQEEKEKMIEEEQRIKENPQQYVEDLKKRKRDIVEKREKRKKMNSQSTSRRSTVGKQKRMKAIAEAAFESQDMSDDFFGTKDEDWNVYLTMANEPDPESEEEMAELLEIDAQLEKYSKEKPEPVHKGLTEVDYQIYLSVERIRIPEVLFQPSLLGSEQMGLSEAIFHTLNQFSKEQQALLASKIFITGGNTLFPNFTTRILNEVRAIRPVGSPLEVVLARNPLLDAWRGASKWASEEYSLHCIDRRTYEEKGGDYIREHFASNYYYHL